MHFLILFFTLAFSSITFAQGIQYTSTTNEWVFEKNADHCLIKNRYDNGTTFILAKNNFGVYRLALHFPHQNLIADKSYTVDILIDDKKKTTAKALVVTPSVLAIALPFDPPLIEQFGRGNTLTISGPKDMVQFALKGTSNGIKKLNTCVEKKQLIQSNEMPRLPNWLEKILLQIDMKDIRTIQIDNNQNLPLDHAWVTPDLFGGIKIISYDKNKTSPKNITENYLGAIEKICSGSFLSERSTSVKSKTTEFIPYDLVCSTQKNDTITGLLFGVEEKNITVFFFESDVQGKSLEKRNILLKVLTQ